MTKPSDFRARARQVREQARQQLRQLREERLVQRKGPLRAPDPGETTAEAPLVDEPPAPPLQPQEPDIAETDLASPDLAQDPLPEPAFRAEPAVEKPKPRKPAKAPKSARKTPAPPAPPMTAIDPAEERRIRQAALAEMEEDEAAPPLATLPQSETAPQPGPDADAPRPDLAEDQAPVCEALALPTEPEMTQAAVVTLPPPEQIAQGSVCELTGLPGAGPGLVWMLQRCGIATLADLAACDPQKLSVQLGLIGQILDVAVWRDFAVQHGASDQEAQAG